MTAVEELTALYEQWRQLTVSEGKAIQSASWSRVEQCQSAKARLQPRIVEISQRLEDGSHKNLFRPILSELMEMERRNNLLLEEMRRASEGLQRDLDRSSRNLRQIHKSYVPPARTHWQSYS